MLSELERTPDIFSPPPVYSSAADVFTITKLAGGWVCGLGPPHLACSLRHFVAHHTESISVSPLM